MTLRVPPWAEVIVHELAKGQYIHELRRLEPTLRTGDLRVVDAGANVGLFSYFAQQIVGPIHTTGFEPLEENRDWCARNWADIPHVLRPEALSDHAGATTLHLISGTGATVEQAEYDAWGDEHNPAEDAETREAQLVTLDSLDVGRVDLFKLDIEGSEEAALRGAERTLRRDRPVVLCAYEHYTNDRDRIADFALSLGYSVRDDAERRFLTFEAT